jgi:BASS family bile acid:Na+ symporter
VNVIMPLFVLWMAMVFSLRPAVAVALLALALSPVPPFLPLNVSRAGGEASYTVALLAAESVLAIFLIPIGAWLLGEVLATALSVAPGTIAKIVVTGVLLPLTLGILVRRTAPTLASRLARPVGIIAMALLAIAFAVLLVAVWRPITSLIGNGTILSIVVIALVGLGVGHALGGPEAKHRPVLAIATASRHPAVAIAILASTFPNQKLAPAAVVLALLTTAGVGLAYARWAKGHATPVARRSLLIQPPPQRPTDRQPGPPVSTNPPRRQDNSRPDQQDRQESA